MGPAIAKVVKQVRENDCTRLTIGSKKVSGKVLVECVVPEYILSSNVTSKSCGRCAVGARVRV